MKQKYKNIILLAVLIFFAGQTLRAQNFGWESEISLPMTFGSFYDGTMGHDIKYDNYGMHVVFKSQSTDNLNYYLIGNDGEIIQTVTGFGVSGSYGFATYCYQGSFYVISMYGNTFTVQKKTNTPSSSFQTVAQSSATNYNTQNPGSTNFTEMGITEVGGKLYFLWDGAGYNSSGHYGNIGIGYFDPALPSQDIIKFFSPVDDSDYSDFSGGWSPKVTSDGSNLYIVYSKATLNDNFFAFRKLGIDQNGNPTYTNAPIFTGSWSSPSLQGYDYINETTTRANILCDGSNLYLTTNLTFYTGSLFIDTKFKVSSTSGISWNSTSNLTEGTSGCFYTPPQIINNQVDGPDLIYSTNTAPDNGNIKPYNPSTGQFLSTYGIIQIPQSAGVLYGVTAAQSQQGFTSLFYVSSTSGAIYRIVRRPVAINSNITYDMLLTGTEYFNAPSSPWIHSNGADITGRNNSITTVYPDTRIYIDAGDVLNMEAGSTLNLGDNSRIIIDGAGAKLKLNANCTLNVGTNAKIEIKNGGYAEIDGAIINSSSLWDGIYFENAGSSSLTSYIKNCTITNAKTSVKIYNTSTSTANNSILIEGNNITVPSGGSYGIYGDHINNIFIAGNQLSANSGNPKPCIYLKHPYLGDGLPGGGASPEFNLKIVNNAFSNTNAAMILAGYTSALVPYYIYGNTGSVTGYGMIGRRITGDIKNNNITSSASRNYLIHQSDPNFYNNIIKSTHSTGTGLTLLSESSPNLAPVTDQSDFVWTSGNNHIEGNGYAIQFNYINSIILNYGQNTFKVASGTDKYHLYGPYNNSTSLLKASNNCWEPNGPNNLVWSTSGPVSVLTTNTPNYLCRSITPTSSIITDMGNGIYDTTWMAESDAIESSGDDEIIYDQGMVLIENSSYLDAISAFKALINDYEESELCQTILPDLYYCHEVLDTFTSQTEKSIHYGALKTFLEDKISSGLYDSKFDAAAYDYTLMCAGNMGIFESQVTGYEFLSLYHPDPESRLMASEDLAIVEDLLEGEGGGSNNLTAEQYLKKIKTKIDRMIMSDPILNKVKQSYDRVKQENKKNLEKDLNNKYGKEKAEIKLNKIRTGEERIDHRVRENMSMMRNLSKEEKEKRHFETIMILASFDNNGSIEDNIPTALPIEYSLSQNYPNPFNPTTNISFSIPKDLVVKIKIYDITGREISTLINEMQVAGNHSISFNGGNLSSGVYFYKIEAGSFVETKRMMLIK